ncbi:MAG: tetratricopeptide repeat protein, partial [Tepidisphaerales bacterium]
GIRSMTQTQNWIGNRQLWSHTLSVNPDSYVAMVSLAQEAMDTNASDAVGDSLRRALKLNPNYVRTHQALRDFYTIRRQIDPAIVHFRRSLEIMETFPDSQRPDLAPEYLALAELLLARGRTAEALVAAKKSRQISPANPAVPAMLDRIRAATSRPTTAPANRR